MNAQCKCQYCYFLLRHVFTSLVNMDKSIQHIEALKWIVIGNWGNDVSLIKPLPEPIKHQYQLNYRKKNFARIGIKMKIKSGICLLNFVIKCQPFDSSRNVLKYSIPTQ